MGVAVADSDTASLWFAVAAYALSATARPITFA